MASACIACQLRNALRDRHSARQEDWHDEVNSADGHERDLPGVPQQRGYEASIDGLGEGRGMKILKLSQQATVSRPVDSIIGWEEKTIYEPVFVVAEHIESFLFVGVSHVKMTSGEKIVVRETPEEIIALLGVEVQTDSLKTWDEIAQKEASQ